MSKKTSLRDFQQYLADRLKSAATGRGTSSLLGIRAGRENWLLDLSDSGEVVQMPPLINVPLTNKAFSGIANIRGSLYAVTDFSLFRGGEPTAMNANARLVLIGTKHSSNAALLVSRMQGLRTTEQFEAIANAADAPAWVSGTFRDSQGDTWQKIAVRQLLADETFMNIGISQQ